MRNYSLHQLELAETYDADPDLASLARKLAMAQHARQPKKTTGLRALIAEFLAGQHASQVARALCWVVEARDILATTPFPPGWRGTVTGLSITLLGSYDDGMPERLWHIGGRWDESLNAWIVPVERATKLFDCFVTAREDGLMRRAEQDLEDLLRWLTYVEEVAPAGYLFERGVVECQARGIQSRPDLHARLIQATHTARQVAAAKKAGRISLLQEERALREKEFAAAHPAHRLYPLSCAPALQLPVRLDDLCVVFTGKGKSFRIDQAAHAGYGKHLQGHAGEEGAFFYFRPATSVEAEYLTLREAAAARQNRDQRIAEIERLKARFRAEGDCPPGSFRLTGERLLDTQALFGGRSWFEVTADAIWFCQNDGLLNQVPHLANVITEGQAAIGWCLAHDAALEARLRALDAAESNSLVSRTVTDRD